MTAISCFLKRRQRYSLLDKRCLHAVAALFAGLALVAINCPAFAADQEINEEITVVGSPIEAQGVAGSAHFIGQDELEKIFPIPISSVSCARCRVCQYRWKTVTVCAPTSVSAA